MKKWIAPLINCGLDAPNSARLKRWMAFCRSTGSGGSSPRRKRLCQSVSVLCVFATALVTSTAYADPPSYSYTFVATATNNLQVVSAFTNAKVTGAHCDTIANAAAVYLHFYNGQPTMGTTNDVDAVSVPAASSTSGNGRESPTMREVVYQGGIWVALTGGIARNDNTSVAAGVGRCTIYFHG